MTSLQPVPDSFRIPLLKDWHTHPLLYAAFQEGIDLNQDPVETREGAIARVRDGARAGQAGWTIAYGWNSGRYSLSPADFADLPPVVVLNLSLHGLLVNEAGRLLLRQSDPEVASHLDDPHWIECNLRRVLNRFVLYGASPDRMQRFFGKLLGEHGVYYAEEMLLVDEGEIRLFDEAGLASRTRFWAAPDTYEGLPPAARERVQGIKLFTDGAIGTWTAALHEPYQDRLGEAGLLLYEPSELADLMTRYTRRGIPLAIHAIGDRAIDQVVAAVAATGPTDRPKAAPGSPLGASVRIEHVQFISPATARLAKKLGIHLCMQPNFSDDSIHYSDRLPPGYCERNNPFRMLIDEIGYRPGVDLWLGSDGMPHGAREALRQSLFPPCPGQRLALDEFVAGYCMPDTTSGHIEVRVDRDEGRVACRIVTAPVA